MYVSVTLCIAPEALERDRTLQGALHAYLAYIHRTQYGERREDLIKGADSISPGFSALVVADEWVEKDQPHKWKLGVSGQRNYAVLEGDPDHDYYFDEGWPIMYHEFLREEDLVRSGVHHLNGDEASWKRALTELQAKPELGIRTREDLGLANYYGVPEAIQAIGVHEARLTKPLLRMSFGKKASEERLNMHTGAWEKTGNTKER